MKSFEEYLQSTHLEENLAYPNDNFGVWLDSLDTDSLLIYSEGWGRHIKSIILREVTNLTK